MKKVLVLAVLATLALASAAEAGLFRGRCGGAGRGLFQGRLLGSRGCN